jgi:hypothetical protein
MATPPFAGSAIQRVGAAGRAIIQRGTAQIIKHPVLSAAGAAGVVGAAMGAGGERLAMHPGAHMRGFHVSRKTGKIVRNRHMNVCNPRALRRSLRRAHGFAKVAMRTIHLLHPKKKGRFGGFKKRRAK